MHDKGLNPRIVRFLNVLTAFVALLWHGIRHWKVIYNIAFFVVVYYCFVYVSKLYNFIFYSSTFSFLHSYLIMPFASGRVNLTTLWIFWLGGLIWWFLGVCIATVKYYIATKNNGSY